MSHQESTRQDPFTFLKTVVDQEGLNQNEAKNGTDSDKENEQNNIDFTKNDILNSNLNSSSQKSESNMDADMWDEFYNEEEFEEIGKENEESQLKQNGLDSFRLEIPNDRVLDKVVEEEEEEAVDMSNATDTHDSSRFKDGGNNTNDTDSKLSDSEKKNKRKKRKRLFKRRAPPPLSPKSRSLRPIGGSDPNLNDHHASIRVNGHDSSNVSSDQDGGQHFETMSETGVTGNNRKLNRRKQVSRPRCAGPKQSGKGRLEQKYHELEELILRPLPSPAVYVQQTRQQMLRLQNLNHNQSQGHNLPPSSNGLPPTGQHKESERIHTITQVIEEDTNQVYSTMKTVHSLSTTHQKNRPSSAHPKRRPTSAGRQKLNRPQSAGNVRPSSASHGSTVISMSSSGSGYSNSNINNNRGQKANGGRGLVVNRKSRSDSMSSTSKESPKRSDRSESGSKDREDNYSSSFEDGDAGGSRSPSRSPGRVAQHTDNHIKHSSNPALQQWLKVKDREYRQKKREERKKKSKERAEKQEEVIRKQEMLEKGEEKVKEWMVQKRKEAREQARIERKRRKEVEKQLAERQNNMNHAATINGKIFIPIKRPPGKYETEDSNNNSTPTNQQQGNLNDAIKTPTPPPSKFVYKRPVSGRVRLMKLQQERKEDSKKLEEKKKEMERILAEEKERKMRMSYDQWLLKKREEDYAKRKETAKQRALARSDPELDRLVPEMAKRRIENIKRGKRSIHVGDQALSKEINSSFGGGDFGKEGENNTNASSYRLEVSGDRKSLKQRPSSAKPSTSDEMLNPKLSRSPRRPQSANPRVKALMDESKELNPDNSFKLPFPADLGVPKYVAAKQEKLFGKSSTMASSITESSDDKNETSQITSVDHEINRQMSSGVDVVDAESEAEPELKSVADRVIEELHTDDIGDKFQEIIENEKEKLNQSFFVTDGNLDDSSEDQKLEKEEERDEKENAKVEIIDDSKPDKNETDDKDLVSDLKSAGNVSDVNIDAEEKSLEDGPDNVVPPLDFGGNGDNDNDVEDEQNEEIIDGIVCESARDNKDESVNENVNTEESKFYDDVDKVGDSSEVKSSMKHVSFSDEAIIHEDPLIGVSNDYDFFDDDFELNENPEDWRDGLENNGLQVDNDLNYDDADSYDHLDEIETDYHPEEDDEAEDERGEYFGNITPREEEF